MPETMLHKNTSGQSLIEYCTLLILIMTGIALMGPYVVQSWNAHLKGWNDSIQDSFNDPLDKSKNLQIDFEECDCYWKAPCEEEPCCGYDGCQRNEDSRYWHCNITHCKKPKYPDDFDSGWDKSEYDDYTECHERPDCAVISYKCGYVGNQRTTVFDPSKPYMQELCDGDDEGLTSNQPYSYFDYVNFVAACDDDNDVKCEVRCKTENHFKVNDSKTACECPDPDVYTEPYEFDDPEVEKGFLKECKCPKGYFLWDVEKKTPFDGDCGCPPGYKDETVYDSLF